MFFKKIIVEDNFPKGFESSAVQIPDGQRTVFQKLGSSRHARVLKFDVLFNSKAYSIVLKKYLHRNIFDLFKYLFLSTRAQRAVRGGKLLIANGFLSPPIVAHNRKFLMTMEIKDSKPLHVMLEKLPKEQKLRMVEQFAQTVGKMHDKGIFHGDLRLGNVLVKKNGENFDFYFLDNERTKKFNDLPMRLRIKNLVQINMNRDAFGKECLDLFFDVYFSRQTKPLDSQKIIEKTALKTDKRLKKKSLYI